jgi:hypothetical protein
MKNELWPSPQEIPGTSSGYSPATVFGFVPIVTSLVGLKIVDQYDEC